MMSDDGPVGFGRQLARIFFGEVKMFILEEECKAMDELTKKNYAVMTDENVGRMIEITMIELDRAEMLFPVFPADPVHAAAIIAEEAGELVRACNQVTYENGTYEQVQKELVQTAAMCLRMMKNFSNLRTSPSEMK